MVVHSSMLSSMIGITNVICCHVHSFMHPGWAVLKPDKMGGEETEARKADCVEWPSASRRRVLACGLVNY